MSDHFRQAFREEAVELLAELEAALLELEKSPADGEIIGRVFRALHTIKGSSAMFGFDAISAFTHEIETVFELVRAGGAAVSRELVALTLQARDLIKGMLASPGGEDGESGTLARQLAESFREMAPVTAAAPGFSLPGHPSRPDDAAPGEMVSWRIRFRPGPETFLHGINPIHLLNGLRLLGECRVIAVTDQVPPLEELDPALCHLSWEILLTTSLGIDAIRDAFIFAGDDGVEIEAVAGTAGGEGPVTPRESAGERQARESISSIRVSAEKLDRLVNLVGEMVTVQARLSQTATSRNDPELVALAEEVERLTGELRDNALNIRMLPIGSTFSRFGRLVHDLAGELGKEVALATSGAETELDKTVIEKLNDPLVHLIRNSIDHGIEHPEIRLAGGKPGEGTISLAALHSGDSVLLSIRDDGAGIDRDAVRARGVEKGLIPAGAELADRELFNLLFAPGFSTSDRVTSVSGRGVGLDVVKTGVDALRGTIAVTSEWGVGTTITIRIPLTLAIIESLLVRVGSDSFVLPLSLVEECIELSRADAARGNGRHLINVRGRVVPYIPLRERFGIRAEAPAIQQIVITEVEGKPVGLLVDQVIGEHQTVIKSMGKMFRDATEISGATILGDGTVALILDVPQLVRMEEGAEGCQSNMAIHNPSRPPLNLRGGENPCGSPS